MAGYDEAAQLHLQLLDGRRAQLQSRRRDPYASSHQLERWTLSLPEGTLLEVMAKCLDRYIEAPFAGATGLPGDRAAWQERFAYTELLAGRVSNAPALVGVASALHEHWLLLEVVDAIPLTQIGDFQAWRQTARAAARFHNRLSTHPRAPMLRRPSGAAVRNTLRRSARVVTPELSSAEVDTAARRAAAALRDEPATIAHGELYPANVLARAPSANQPGWQITFVDFETVCLAPGPIDLAALSTGWPPSERISLAETYRRASDHWRDRDDRSFQLVLAAATAVQAARWLGRPHGRPSIHPHPHDWPAELRTALAALLA